MDKEIYRIIDSFLVEAKDQNGKERSLEQLNQDRHLAAEALVKLSQSKVSDFIQELEGMRATYRAANATGSSAGWGQTTGWNSAISKAVGLAKEKLL